LLFAKRLHSERVKQRLQFRKSHTGGSFMAPEQPANVAAILLLSARLAGEQPFGATGLVGSHALSPEMTFEFLGGEQ
jgi:hypothetical protein